MFPKTLKSIIKKRRPFRELYSKKNKEYSSKVEKFLESEEYAVTLPGKKQVYAKLGKPKIILNQSLKSLYAKFKAETQNPKSFATFAKNRPRHIKTRDKTEWVQCLCEVCENLNLKREAADKVLHVGYREVFDLWTASLCEREGTFNKRKCVERECEQCGANLVKTKYLEKMGDNKEALVKWKVWERVEIAPKKFRKVKVQKESSLEELVNLIVSSVNDISLHMHTFLWQHYQYKCIRKSPDPGMVVLVMDFSENYRCDFQREVSSAHFGYQQITLHTMRATFLCPDHECCRVCNASITVFSDDLMHDHFSVKTFVSAAVEELKAKGVLVNHMIQFTDGCRAQYKCCHSFFDISTATFCSSLSRNYFAPGHGKTLCDGQGGLVKSTMTNAVKTEGHVINSAKDAFDYFQSKPNYNLEGSPHELGHDYNVVLCINEVDRTTVFKAATVLGCDKYFSIAKIEERCIGGRNLSCFCTACRSGGECENSDQVGAFVERTIKEQKKKSPSADQKKIKKKNRPVKKNKGRRKSDHHDKEASQQKSDHHDEESQQKSDHHDEEECQQKSDNHDEEETPRRSSRRAKAINVVAATITKPKKGYKTKNRCARPDPASEQSDARISAFTRHRAELRKKKTFEDYHLKALEIEQDIQKYPLPLHLSTSSLQYDMKSMELYPADASKDWVPYKNFPDGNCLYRAASQAVWGNELGHVEIRVRVAVEMAVNEDYYLDPAELDETGSANLPALYCQYTESYDASVLAPAEIRRHFR